ncbi:MAG: DUF4214 domain-containing protein [Acidimicrobiales bacterium]
MSIFALSVFVVSSPANAEVEEFSAYSASSELAEVHADVFRLYWAFFDREPDVVGARYWVGQHDQCSSLLDITWSFGSSTEFESRYGSLSNEQYVELVYANVLDRVPDDEGLAYWVSLLESGELIQAEVMLYFSLGDEFKRLRPLPSDGRPYSGCTDPNPEPAPVTTPEPEPASVYYANCDAARAAGAAPVRRGDPGYRAGLDRDDDGVGCEN